jgi:hypothetical protein
VIIGVNVVWNNNAPPGWCEIQRDDGSRVFRDDEMAAAAVCYAAGAPADCAATVLVFDLLIGSFLAAPIGETADRAELDETIAEPVCVPAVVAFRAGLIDKSELREATLEWT